MRFFLVLLATGVLFFAGREFLLPRLDIQPFQEWISQLPIEEIEQRIVSSPEPLKSPAVIPDARLTRSGIIAATNAARKEFGLPVLAESAQLDRAAEAKADDMFARQYFDHVSPTGEGPDHWVEQAGYRYRVIGENLALGDFLNDGALVDAWMASPGHRENIVNPEFTEIGVAAKKGVFDGRTTWIAVQEFGRPAPNCSEPDSALRIQIEQYEQSLSAYETRIEEKRAEIEESERTRSPKYRQDVKEYNELVAQYNALVETLKQIVTDYNAQVAAYNECLKSE